MTRIAGSLRDLCLAGHRVRLIVNVLFVAAWTPCTGSNSEDRNGNSERLEHLLKKM